jgi:inorganic pyrophosphatase
MSREIEVIVEIPVGSFIKYEIKDNQLYVDRILDHNYPANYGFIPGTLAADGDAEDVFVLGPYLYPGSRVRAKAIGIIPMIDNGVQDDKIVAIIDNWLPFEEIAITEITYFLKTYKAGTEVGNFIPYSKLPDETI